MQKVKAILRKYTVYKKARAYWSVWCGTFRSKISLSQKIRAINLYQQDLKKYQTLQKNPREIFSLDTVSPQIFDKTVETPLDPVYFYQDCWCAKKVFEQKPKNHYDIGSKAEMVGIISQFVPTTMIDIRPIPLTLPNLHFVKGDILALPFRDGSIESLSSICVIEHIGLGRYGDTLDQFGTEKALAEMKRVLAKSGSLYISVPVDVENRVYFNAHRAFTRDYILSLAHPLSLIDEKYIYGKEMCDHYDLTKGFGTGLYHFKKEK